MTDQQDKTEQATPHKLEEARKRGLVPRSPDLLSFTMLTVFILVLSATAGRIGDTLAQQFYWWLDNASHATLNNGVLSSMFAHVLKDIGYAFTPVLMALIIAAVLINSLFHGFVFSTEPFKPDFSRLNPVTGFKRIVSRKALNELAKVLVKALAFGLALSYVAKLLLADLAGMEAALPHALPALLLKAFMTLATALLLVMAAAALWDMWLVRADFGRQMRMSRRDLKDEHRKREGDPEVRAKRKAAQQQFLRKLAALGNIKDADVIITNPTHVAVALKYRPQTMAVPVVLALGRGLLAGQIISRARGHRIPVIRRPPLARELYKRCGINHPIPGDTQADVATIYRWVIALPGNKVVMP